MSLKDAIAEIAADMEREVEEWATAPSNQRPPTPDKVLKGYLRQLKTALKASEGEEPARRGVDPTLTASPQAQHAVEIERYRRELREKQGNLAPLEKGEEKFAEEMLEVVDGPGGDSLFPTDPRLDPNNPKGIFTLIAGGIYRLRREAQRKWWQYDEEETRKAVARQQGQS